MDTEILWKLILNLFVTPKEIYIMYVKERSKGRERITYMAKTPECYTYCTVYVPLWLMIMPLQTTGINMGLL